MKSWRIVTLLLLVVSCLFIVSPHRSLAANPAIGIDPTGSGGTTTPYVYADLWTNMTDSGLVAGFHSPPPQTPYPIDFIAQSRIGTMQLQGMPVSLSGLNTTFELTYETRLPEMVDVQQTYTDGIGRVHESTSFSSGENASALITFYIDKISDGSSAKPNGVSGYGDDDTIGPVLVAHLVSLAANFDLVKTGLSAGTGTGSYDVSFMIDMVNKDYIDIEIGTIIGVKMTGSVNQPSFYKPTVMWDGTSTASPNLLFRIDGSEMFIVGPKIPKVCIVKKTNGSDANNPDGADVPMISAGGQVTWDYEVTNCGNVPVANADVVVTDSQTGVTPTFASETIGNGDNVFDPGEVWLYKATGVALDLLLPQGGVATVPSVCTHGGQLPPRTAYSNIGTVTIPGATASDPSSYCNPPAPCVTIVKYTNGADANNPDGTDVPNIGTGLSVNWTYKVTNCGNVSVATADVHVTDNQGVIPVYVSGDLNINGLFDPGEIWIYQATGVAFDLLTPPAGVLVQPGVCTHGQTEPPRTAYINLGTVNIPDASASDPSSYCNPPGHCVTIIKKTNGVDANDPDGAGVPIINLGDPVTWTYEIKNCGNVSVAKADVILNDNQPGVTPSYTSGDVNNNSLFDPDEVWLYTATGIALDLLTPPAGVQVKQNVCTQGGTVQPPQTAYVNLGTVTIPGASATDPSSYCNPPPRPCVKIVKYTNGVDANDPDAADVPVVSVGDPVTWTYKVSNCGDVSVAMTEVKVVDNQPGVNPVFDSVLFGNPDSYFDPGEDWLYKATGTVLDLSIFQLGVTTVPDVCTHNSTQPKRTAYFNTGTVTIPGATAFDPSSYCNPPELFGACRMTGGNVTIENAIVSNPWAVTNSKAKASKNAAQLYTSYTVGGQIGAPRAGCADSPGAAFGEWTHTQHSGFEGSFTFHSGTNSAPDDSFIKCITCADPGWCVHARCAPFKQIFWEGTGVFKNEKGFSAKFNSCTVNTFSNKDKTYSLHYYKAHVGDFGEPGNTGKQKSFDPSVCKWRSGGVNLSNAIMMSAVPDDKFGDKGGQTCEACPDWYEIEIHCSADPSSAVIYRGAGFITGGNYQIHPEVGDQCPFP